MEEIRIEEIEKKEQLQQALKMRKRTLLIVGIIVAGLIAIPLLVILLVNLFFSDNEEYEPISIPSYSSMYYCEPYDGNILEYDEYLKQDRQIYYYDNPAGYGSEETITASHADPKLQFLYRYFQYAITADTERYNELFTPTYLQKYGYKTFAQQMIYDVKIYLCGTETDVNGNVIYEYQLDYKIMENNGTFRNDILNHETRSQYLKLLVDKNGTMAIDDIYFRQYAQVKK